MNKHIRRIILIFLIIAAGAFSCKKEEKVPEPAVVLKKWARSIQELNYRLYSECEAYPKEISVFKDMYKEYYIADIMAVDIEKPDEKDIKKDYLGNQYIRREVMFEGTAVKRETKKPYQIIRGDAVFINFLEGERKGDGWLLSNRTITRIHK